MSFGQEFNLYMPEDMMAAQNFNSGASTDTPDGDALDCAQTGWPINGIWYPLQNQPTWAGNAPQQEYHTNFTGHDSWPLASHSQFPGYHPVPYSHWVDHGWAGVSPSHGNNLLPLNLIQHLAPNTYEHPYFPAPDEGGCYNASTARTSVGLPPDPPLDEGIISRVSDAVVEVDDSVSSAPPEHLHRKAGRKGEDLRVHDCAYDGKEEPLERDRFGYSKPTAIYQRLPNLKTESIDFTVLREGEAHGVKPDDGSYICRMRSTILGGVWRRDNSVCNKTLRDKDCYRRHLEEQHFGLRRKVDGKHATIKTRIERALEEIKAYEILKAKKERRSTKKRNRDSDEDNCLGGSLPEREKTKKRRRAETV